MIILKILRKKRTIKKYSVSYPLIGMSIAIAIGMMLSYYALQHYFDNSFPEESYLHLFLKMVPSIFYSLVVILTNLGFKFGAIALTNWGIKNNLKFLIKISNSNYFF